MLCVYVCVDVCECVGGRQSHTSNAQTNTHTHKYTVRICANNLCVYVVWEP